MSLLEKCYMRRHSQHIRLFSKRKLKSNEEDKIDETTSSSLRVIVVILCRNRERLLSQVFKRWKDSVNVEHDYDEDMRIILLRRALPNERRSELEIEVMYKWVLQNHAKDPSGLSNLLISCKRKACVVDALQQCRLEMYLPGETIVIQGDLPRLEDGQFTILSGSCEFITLDDDSMPLLKLRSLPDKARRDVSKELLQMGRVIGELSSPCGFGELASLSKVKRPVSIRASLKAPVEFIMVPRKSVVNCFSKLRGPPVSEAVDFLRQASMAHKVVASELLVGATAMVKRVLPLGTILFYKGQPVDKVFLVVNGEVLLDTEGCIPSRDGPLPFQNPDVEKCYCMSGQSILGDEGLCGVNKTYETTAAVISEFATIFEVSSAGKEFLLRRFELERYSALAYKDQMIQTAPLKTLENVILLHSSFNNLRKAISVSHRDRGVKPTNAVTDESDKIANNNFSNGKAVEYVSKLNKNCLRNAIRVRKVMQKRSLQELRIAAKESIISDDYFSGEGNETSLANTKTVEDAEGKVKRALSAFYERRLRLKDQAELPHNAGLNIASHSMSMLISAASNVMGDEIRGIPSCEESSYSGSVATSTAPDPTLRIREHLRQLQEVKETSAERLAAALKMEESLRLPIASGSNVDTDPAGPALPTKSKRAVGGGSADAAAILNKHFVRVSTRRSQKTLEYCEGILGTKNFERLAVETQKNDRKTPMLRATSLLQCSTQHPSLLFPDTKEALLDVLHEKWEVDPIRKAALLAGQQTPRYFKVSNNGKRYDPLVNLEHLVNTDSYYAPENGSLASFDSRSSASRHQGTGVSLLLKDVDSIAQDAFIITTHRKERYESPPSSRAGTPAAPGGSSRPSTADAPGPQIPDGNLLSYFERMKTPPLDYDAARAAAAATASGNEQTPIGSDANTKPLSGLKKRWGKLRTAVALSSALDPDRALKQYERAIRLEPKTSKYLEGKRKTAGASKYALAPVRLANRDDEAPLGHSTDFVSSVDSWKLETLHELFQTKNEPKRSVPVLSTAGAQALYWEKQIVETVPKSGQVENKHLTYHQVHSIHQNRESQRYKRRQQRNRTIG